MPVPVLALVEGAHDTIFFRKSLHMRDRHNVKIVKFAQVADQIRRMFPGTLLVDCEGSLKMHFMINRTMRDLIMTSVPQVPKLVGIGDGDRFSPETVRRKLREFLDGPSRNPRLEFQVDLSDHKVGLRETTKGRQLEIECHAVPQSLEDQIYAKLPTHVKEVIPSSLTIDDKLKTAIDILSLPELDSLIESSAEQLAEEVWASEATASIIACLH